MSKKIKVAFLGMGNMGKAHANNIMKFDETEIVALCSYQLQNAKNFAQANSLECELYDDGFKMIEQSEIDVLYVCLPPFAHSGQIEAAAKKGIHIFVEKPIAKTLERGLAMKNAVIENGVYSQVGYHMRFGGAVRKLKELVENGTAGRPTLFTANYECNSLHTPWWIDVEKCGGQVFEQVIHLYDLALHFMGQPDSVNGYISNLCHNETPGYTVEDTSISAIKFKNGSLGGISGSNCAVKNEWNGFFKVVCENLVAEFKDFNNAIFTFTEDETKRVEVVSTDVNAIYEEDRYFIDVILGEKPQTATILDGFTGLQMVSAVVSSSKNSGMQVKIY